MNILLIGYTCEPGIGSEQGVGWNWAWHLAERNAVWVIAHGFYRTVVEQYLRDHPRPNLHFVWVGPLGWQALGYRFQYLLWRWAAVTAAKRLIAEQPIDIIHHVSWNTISAPPLFWKTGKPFVWGPVGGGQALPWRFLTSVGFAAVPELLRNLRIALMPWTPSLRRTVARSDLLLAANRESAAVLRRAGARNVELLPDMGIPAALLMPPNLARADNPKLIVLWAGRLVRWKGLSICLTAAKALRSHNAQFLIAGWGRHQWVERYVRRLGLEDRVTFLGRLSWEEMQQRFTEANLLMFTSLRDTSGNVNFEALAKGCPVICLNHAGVGCHLSDAVAIKVPVTTPRAAALAMARWIDLLASDRERLRQMSRAAYHFAMAHEWKNRALHMEQLYRQVLERSATTPALAAPASTQRRPALLWARSYGRRR
jgi:glycosyltransferase involved in cell wall biosynthesis